MRTALPLVCLLTAYAAKGPAMPSQTLDAHVGAPVDIAPWTYVWRADRKVQPQPEAEFIPRRLERIDRVYRTAMDALPPDQLKSIYYDQRDLLTRLPPKPQGRLLTGLLWRGGLADCRIEVRWPEKGRPDPASVEVRTYPTAFGWFGWTVDRVLPLPEVSQDGRRWFYRTDPAELMDTSYSGHIPAATEMVAVFCSEAAPVPDVRITSPAVGEWQRIDVEIEWGFGEGARGGSFDGRLEGDVALLGGVTPLPGDDGTAAEGPQRWRSRPGSGARRGITVPVLYARAARPGLDSRVTLRSRARTVTFRVADLERGPIVLPREGLFITRAGSGPTARGYVADLERRAPSSVRQAVQDHAEPASFDELMREVRMWTVPGRPEPAPFPAVPDPPMRVELSDAGWTAAWRAACDQLTGAHMWGGLAFEVARVTHAMEMVGLHRQADDVYQHFLKAPGAAPDGDYVDGAGALEWATSLRHGMGYSHDGTHASTGRLLLSMADRVFLKGDDAWFLKNRARLQAAADWIIRQRREYLAHVPNRGKLHVAGLLPPAMLGDYALPACDWHWYYVDNVLAVQGLQRFADALARHDAEAGRKYRREAAAFRADLRRTIDREAALAPVRLGRDGAYHQFVPRQAYLRGLTGLEIGAPQFPEVDLWMGSLPVAEPFGAVEPGHRLVRDTLDVMEEMGTSEKAVREREEARRAAGLPTADAWFWHTYSILPKASFIANTFLLQDDIPNFLRFWGNQYAAMVASDGKLWEHAHLGNWEPCKAPDNGTAGWFIECFRNMLVTEDGDTLWVARGTPRAWLAQGKRIAVANAPTYFGTLAYEIASEADLGRITARLSLPEREPPGTVVVRLRHPMAAALRGVTVNGRKWTRFDAGAETVTLKGMRGQVTVVAEY